MQEQKERKLYVPANVTLRNEFIEGLSIRDTIKTALVSGGALAVAVALYLTLRMEILWCVLLVMMTGAAAMGLLRRLPVINRSMVEQMAIIIRYRKAQKVYRYAYRKGRRH